MKRPTKQHNRKHSRTETRTPRQSWDEKCARDAAEAAGLAGIGRHVGWDGRGRQLGSEDSTWWMNRTHVLDGSWACAGRGGGGDRCRIRLGLRDEWDGRTRRTGRTEESKLHNKNWNREKNISAAGLELRLDRPNQSFSPIYHKIKNSTTLTITQNTQTHTTNTIHSRSCPGHFHES